MLVGILVLSLGLWMIYLVRRGWARAYGVGLAIALYFSIWGIAIVLTSYLQLEAALAYVICFGVAFLFAGVGVWIALERIRFNCRIQATYRGYEELEKGKYVPRFAYMVKKRTYLESEVAGYRKPYLEKRFIEGHQYKIWIKEKDPKLFISRKRIEPLGLAVFGVGVWIMFMPFVYLL